MTNQDYKYKDVPLIPTIAKELILELFSNQIVRRIEIANKVLETHLSRGGLEPNVDYLGQTKKALHDLKKEGLAVHVTYGTYRIKESRDIDTTLESSKDLTKTQVYGKGRKTVYLYYYPTYKKYATLKGKNSWPCKVGRTDVQSKSRIMSQAGTAMPEEPFIALEIKTDDATRLETVIHFKFSGKKINCPGNEWYNTSPEEVIDFLKNTHPTILEV